MEMHLEYQLLGGEVFFDECYNVNPLVNAFSAIMKKII